MAHELWQARLTGVATPLRDSSLVKGTVFDIKRYSIHDGPGIRTTVFLKGCPLGCSWCHNPESQAPRPEVMVRDSRCIHCGACVAACPQGAIRLEGEQSTTDRDRCTLCGSCVQACYAEAREIVGREMELPEVLAAVERDLAFYEESGGGVTFSGGEPLAQPSFLLGLLRACSERGIHTVVDTCGFSTWAVLDGIREWVDLFLYDLKVMDGDRHSQLTGVSNELILSNLKALSTAGHPLVVRVPLIPGVNDDSANVRAIGEFVAALPRRYPVELLPYHRTAVDKYRRLNRAYALGEIEPPSRDQLVGAASILQRLGLEVRIGG